MSDQYWHRNGALGLVIRADLRTLQFVFAVIVAALYGVDLHVSHKNSSSVTKHGNGAWAFAEVVAGLSIITCAIHCFVTVKRVAWCAWDFVMFIWWIALFGVFGKKYFGGESSGEGDFTTSMPRMKAAVCFDFLNVILWFATTLGVIVWCCTARRVTRKTDMLELGKEAEAGGPFGDSHERVDNEFDEKTVGDMTESGRRLPVVKQDDDETTLREVDIESIGHGMKEVAKE